MTAPTRTGSRDVRARTATRAKPPSERSRSKPDTTRDRSTVGRARSAAAQRAYARRAQRSEKVISTAGECNSQPVAPARAPFVVLVMGLLVAGAAATLWLSTQATADSYRLEQAKQQASTLAEQVEQLQADVAREQSPGALADKATALGMVPTGDPAHLVLGYDGKVRVVGQPQVAQRPLPPPTPPRASPARGATPNDRQRQQGQPDRQPAERHQAQRQQAQRLGVGRAARHLATARRAAAEDAANGGD